MRAWWCLLVLLAALDPALAQKPPAGDDTLQQARAHLRAGEKHYVDGRYEEAAREMEAAYALRAAADLQYNVAQCYERLGRVVEARAAYRKYLDGKPDAEDRVEILTRIRELEERIRAGGSAPATAPPRERVVLKTVVVYRDAPPPPGRGARFAAWGLGGLAVGALASGVTFAVLSARNADQVTQGGSLMVPTTHGGRIADADSSGRSQAVVSAVSFGVAGAAALGAVGLALLGARIDREGREAREAREARGESDRQSGGAVDGAARVALSPWLGGGGAGLVVAGSF